MSRTAHPPGWRPDRVPVHVHECACGARVESLGASLLAVAVRHHGDECKLPPCTAGDTGCGLAPCVCRYPPDLMERLTAFNHDEIEAERVARLESGE